MASAARVKLVVTIAFETMSKYLLYGSNVLLSKTNIVPIVKSPKKT